MKAFTALSSTALLVATLLFLPSASVAAPQAPLRTCEEPSLKSEEDNWEGPFFPGIDKIEYEGPDSKDVFAFHYYNADEVVHGKPMKEWLRFSVAFWHSFRGDGSDPFGSPTRQWPWEDEALTEMAMAKRRMRANFELMEKLGVDFWCFHDRDIAPEGASLKATDENLAEIVAYAKSLQDATGKRVLWGTAQLFKHPRYMHGAMTSPYKDVYERAGAQVKRAMEATHALGGANYVFWGGREGYQTLLNTDMGRELDHQAAFMRAAAEHKRAIGFNGTLLIEPKPQEPTKHQYDWDVATTAAFLYKHGLSNDFKVNVECNHATLSGHSCEHELEAARYHGLLGNVDANAGDPQTGWDTDEFLTDPKQAALIMLSVLRNGGLGTGGFNFDAKLRRESVSVDDLVLAHVSGMDALARGLRSAAAILAGGELDALVAERYASFDAHAAAAAGPAPPKVSLDELERLAMAAEAAGGAGADGVPPSGRQEKAERILAMYL